VKRDYFLNPLLRAPSKPLETASGAYSGVLEQVDQRSHPRFAVRVMADVIDPLTQAQVSGRVTDLGIGGCYVEAVNPFAERTPVRVVFTEEKRTFRCAAIVVFSRPGAGMGLAFTEVALDEEISLLEWVSELGNRSLSAARYEAGTRIPLASATERNTESSREKAALLELLTLLLRKKIISDSEAAALRSRLAE
jgi:hypothetical protein